ncbi:MAG: hypothetical protein K5880_13610 [Hydrogenophaga sp.]|uniref:hypothetical protein n=1 Tax=Hydrogenophaga sp. TaxID=1904254 RepID=UPI00260E10DF|nr:hypothetical protein [Hydrogenophaga sp.]MCV0439657.1 hypothetical protein [Hydrogenophaga sp.]
MNTNHPTPGRDELLARFLPGLSTRTMRQVAEEARLDGESLNDLVARYEIDFAWHVLAADRTRDAVLTVMELRLGQPVDDAQRADVREVLQAASAAVSTELLMSFDNDVPAQLARLLCEGFDRQSAQVAQAA